MERTPVTSSNIKSVGYDAGSKTLEVEFLNGTLYQYFGVHPDHFTQMIDPAMSAGKHLNMFIKGKHSFEQIDRSLEEPKTEISAKMILDSVSPSSVRLASIELIFPKYVLAELNTHRQFCLAGDSKLEFDLPAGGTNTDFRSHRMTIAEFVRKWHEGALEHKVPAFVELDMSVVQECRVYSAKELAEVVGFKSASNLRLACRSGDLEVLNPLKRRDEDFLILGSAFITFRKSQGRRKFSLVPRLKTMRIRQINEETLKVQHSTVTNCWYSGKKAVYQVSAGGREVAGSLDHRVLTEDGWKTIGDLKPGVDKLVLQRRGKLPEDYLDGKRFTVIDGKHRNHWQKKIKSSVFDRQKGVCPHCREALYGKLEIHHVIPVHQDPSKAFDLGNVELLHSECHTDKHIVQGWQGDTYLYGDLQVVESVVFRGFEDTYDIEVAGEYPNFIANGVVVHNSRSTSSSRAIPSAAMIERTRKDPASPVHWGLNQSGMQAQAEEIDPVVGSSWWGRAARSAARYAEEGAGLGLHKQVANRVVDSYAWANTLVSSTEWENFMFLRCDSAADPVMERLANCIREQLQTSTPVERRIHLPYITEEEALRTPIADLVKISVARCCRISYERAGQVFSFAEDVTRYDSMVASGHWSPLEHVAFAGKDAEFFAGNFRGWVQQRQLVQGVRVMRPAEMAVGMLL